MPEASDGSGGRVSAEVGGTRPSGAKRAVTMATAVAHEVKPGICPTCRAALDEGLASWQCPTPNRCGAGEPSDLLPTPTASDRNGGKVKARGAMLNSIGHLLPAPKASGGPDGGPNMRGSSGDLPMPSVAVRVGTDWGGPAAGRRRARGPPGRVDLVDAYTVNARNLTNVSHINPKHQGAHHVRVYPLPSAARYQVTSGPPGGTGTRGGGVRRAPPG